MWLNFIDHVFLINLPWRAERRNRSHLELTKFGIPYELVSAWCRADGRDGLYLTMMAIFRYALQKKYKCILLFEDDINLVADPVPVLEKCFQQLPFNFDLFYLGCNIPYPANNRFSENILPVSRALSTHAVVYSQKGMERILACEKKLPIDVMFTEKIQKLGDSYCSYPLLATQYAGYSDIEKRIIDWNPFIQTRFEFNTRNIK